MPGTGARSAVRFSFLLQRSQSNEQRQRRQDTMCVRVSATWIEPQQGRAPQAMGARTEAEISVTFARRRCEARSHKGAVRLHLALTILMEPGSPWLLVRLQPAVHFSSPLQRDNKISGDKEGGCPCQCCGIRYKVDLLIPDELWEQIKLKGCRSEFLCPKCIVQRIANVRGYACFHLLEDREFDVMPQEFKTAFD